MGEIPESKIIEDKSIVVLPFVNMSNDQENEYFSDGITEEIINALTKVEGLKVIARTSSFAFKGKNLDVREIGQQLGVANILEGSVRKVSDRVRITAQLINAKNGVHYWSKNFDRQMQDIFALQDEISLLIADQIRENFGHLVIKDHLIQASTRSVSAYEHYLKGRYHQLQWTPDSFIQAIEQYDAAIAKDPEFAKAYYGNLQCYGLLAIWGFMPVEEAMGKAIDNFIIAKELDTELPEYPMSFVGRTLWKEWDYKGGYEYINQTLAMNPKHTDALEAMAELLIALGYFDQAELFVKKALEVDPLSPNHHFTMANVFYLKQAYDIALHYIEKALRINPQFDLALRLKVNVLVLLGKEEEVKELAENFEEKELINLLFAIVNKKIAQIPKEFLDQWESLENEEGEITPYKLFILANGNCPEAAFKLLKSGIELRRAQLMNYRYEPFLQSLKEIEGFENLHQANFSLTGNEEWFAKEKPSQILDEKEADLLKEKLIRYFEKEKPFLDPQLNLNALGSKLELHPNKLSYLINDKLQANFNEYVNNYRLNYFKKIAINPRFNHLTLLALAYDSGFNSKTVFNSFFKTKEGVTPSAWLKKAKSE